MTTPAGLGEYWKKRDFATTPEPRGEKKSDNGFSYVIQKHQASHLHYDFRLELDGVLLSWAVPKGPTLDPSVKRLAMQTEDHPVEYGGFEGTIPQGEYGGGTVMVWDRGTWEPEGDPQSTYRKGRLTFQLHGTKLKGSWHLVRAGADSGKKQRWLLFKGTDELAQKDEPTIAEREQNSALSGRTMEEIAQAKDNVWHSNRAVDETSLPADSKKSALIDWVEPQRATLVKGAPEGEGWIHELKFDGYRMLARLAHGKVTMLTRNGNDWSHRMPELIKALADLPANQAMLDGEIVVLRPDGVTDFQLLQNSLSEGADRSVVYYAFDLLHYNGRDLRPLPLSQRKEILRQLIQGKKGKIRFSDHVTTSGAQFLRHACALHAEGMVSKRIDQPYRSGKGHDWLKTKCVGRQEFIIGGYTDPSGSRPHFGALLLGTRKGASDALTYVGKVGTGFSDRSLKELHTQFQELLRKTSPFQDAPTGAATRDAHWVEPRLVAEVEFTSFTEDGMLRHPSFRGLRQDKPAKDVSLESAEELPPLPKRKAKRTTSKGATVARSATSESATLAKGSTDRSARKDAARSRKATAPAAEQADVPAKQSLPSTKRTVAPAKLAASSDVSKFRLSNPDRVFYPEQGVTKLELAQYYAQVADWMLPHVVNRPLTLVRCPQGFKKACFYQKHAGDSLPEGVRRIPIADKGGPAEYTAIDDVLGLLGLVQLGVLEVHTWGSHADDAEKPDLLVFDLDPDPTVDWKTVVAGANLVRERLQTLELESFVKTTGGKGLHVCVPVERTLSWDDAKEFCRHVSEDIVKDFPKHYVATMSKAARVGKIFIDFFRNGRGATFIAPYSTRARDGATVATPLSWDELSPSVHPAELTVRTVPARLAKLREDPWKGINELRQRVPVA